MPAERRKEYDADEFRKLWHSPMTLEELAKKYGVNVCSVWRAGKRRGWPHRGWNEKSRPTGGKANA